MKLSNTVQMFLAAAALIASALFAVHVNNSASSSQSKEQEVIQNDNSFVLRNVQVFDGTSVIDNTDVWVQHGKISAIGTSLTVPENTPSYNGKGKTLLPGFIDAHTHSFASARSDALRFGVTTELDMFNDWRALKEIKAQREQLNRTEQADLWSAGILATAPGGHGTEYGTIPTINNAADVDVFVQQRADEGSDYIKIVLDDGHAYGKNVRMNTLSSELSQALINAAHQQRKLALFHVASLAQATQALHQGADGLVHVFHDQIVDPEFIATAKTCNLFVVPTLAVTASLSAANEANALNADPQLQPYLTATQRRNLSAQFPAEWHDSTRLARAVESVKRLHDAGVVILAGTDAGNPGTEHGVSLHGELMLLVRAGLSPIEALQAATSLPAKHFSLSDRGRIAIGSRADLVLLNADPTQDIQATRNIAMIWKNGYPINRQIMTKQNANVAPAPMDLIIADFEQQTISSRYGQGWQISTDAMMQGNSVADIALSQDGAQNSQGALVISGSINAGFTFPWAGALFVAATKDQTAVSYAQASTLVFWTKGDGREYKVVAFSATRGGGVPPSQNFRAEATWREIRLPLQAFAGLDLNQVSALAFTAIAPEGKFRFLIDDVHLE